MFVFIMSINTLIYIYIYIIFIEIISNAILIGYTIGKTTLMDMIAGISQPSGGNVWACGEHMNNQTRKVRAISHG